MSRESRREKQVERYEKVRGRSQERQERQADKSAGTKRDPVTESGLSRDDLKGHTRRGR